MLSLMANDPDLEQDIIGVPDGMGAMPILDIRNTKYPELLNLTFPRLFLRLFEGTLY